MPLVPDASEDPPKISKSIPDTKATLKPLISLTPDLPKKSRPLVRENPSLALWELMNGATKGVESIKWVGIGVSALFFK